MTTAQIAAKLVEGCRRHDYLGVQRELYADDAVSIEPEGAPSGTTRGRAAIEAKTKAFSETFEFHGHSVSEPIVSDPFFACTMSLDATERKSGQRIHMSEICVYEVKNGKIVREQFFYPPEA